MFGWRLSLQMVWVRPGVHGRVAGWVWIGRVGDRTCSSRRIMETSIPGLLCTVEGSRAGRILQLKSQQMDAELWHNCTRSKKKLAGKKWPANGAGNLAKKKFAEHKIPREVIIGVFLLRPCPLPEEEPRFCEGQGGKREDPRRIEQIKFPQIQKKTPTIRSKVMTQKMIRCLRWGVVWGRTFKMKRGPAA